MPATDLDKTLLIANPAAQNGQNARRIEEVAALLEAAIGADRFALAPTNHARHAEELAAEAEAGTVIALGGDGLVNEVANGLMARPGADRPALGVIPAGSGNDYAKALGMSSDARRACEQLLSSRRKPVDVGRANGRWFVETLSFGLDAAIALDTVERRKRTGRKGTLLYMESGIDQLFHHLRSWRYTASLDGAAAQGESITFAVQIGPYYGGGFKICPRAALDDGRFSLCIAHPPASIPRALLIFLMAKGGHHTGFRQIELDSASSVHVEFEEEPPAQMDGEHIGGRIFDIEMHPRALPVLFPGA